MSVINLFAAGLNAVVQWRRREQAYAELMALDERALADIGIRRGDIPAILEGVRGSDRERFEPKAEAAKLSIRKLA